MGEGGVHPARAPELLVKLNLLHCLIRAERATVEPALITLLFPTSFPEHLKSPFLLSAFASIPLPFIRWERGAGCTWRALSLCPRRVPS